MKISKGDIFDRVFINEPGLNLHIEQEAGSQVKIVVINLENPTSPDLEISNQIFIEQLGEGCQTEVYALAFLHGEEKVTTETHVLHAVGGGRSNQLVKFVLDDNAAFRHSELFDRLREGRRTLDHYTEVPRDGTTITFVPLDGDIGLISDGAGTGMLALDLLSDMGGRAASFCELGGTTPASTMYKAMEYTFSAGRRLKCGLIVLIGGFNRMDDMANGIVSYIRDHGLDVPLFVRMVGNMEETGRQIMADAGLKTYSILTETIADAVAASGG